MKKKFIKNKEDFTCGNCGVEIKGDGYTNHCNECLWSKHVDINPGDRASECGGQMEPRGVDQKEGEFRILHKCKKCGYEKFNNVSENDKMEEIIKVSKKNVFRS